MHAFFFEPPVETNYIGHQLAEVYRDQVYTPYLQGKKDLTIVDIGANIGITTYYFSQFAERVISVEPSAQHFEILKRMLAFNKLDNVFPVNKAIFMKSGTYSLYHNTNRTMFSLHQGVSDGSSKEEMVECITIEELFEKFKIKHCDLLKVDIEGSEMEVFSHPSFQSIANKVDTIITERHAWSGRHPNQLVEALKNVGFQVDTIPNSADLVIAKR